MGTFSTYPKHNINPMDLVLGGLSFYHFMLSLQTLRRLEKDQCDVVRIYGVVIFLFHLICFAVTLFLSSCLFSPSISLPHIYS